MRRQLALVVSFALAATARAQTLRYEFPSLYDNEGFGSAVAGVGDVDGDGHDDVAVAAPMDSIQFDEAGRVSVFSGKNGFPLYLLFGSQTREHFGWSLSGLGDLDGDGYDDLIVGTPDYYPADGGIGHVIAFSGKHGTVIHEIRGRPGSAQELGYSVAGLGDVDGNGYLDYAVGAPREDSDRGAVYVYSGPGPGLIKVLAGTQDGARFGEAVGAAGDVNGDGFADLIVGSPRFDGALWHDEGRIAVYSVTSGNVLFGYSGSSGEDRLGTAVSGAGDVDLDGFSDIIVGAPYANNQIGYAVVLSGNGAVLDWQSGGHYGSYFGWSITGGFDVNGDCHADYAVGAPQGGTSSEGEVKVFSGLTHQLMYTFDGKLKYGGPRFFGSAIANARDTDQDGVGDLLIGASDGWPAADKKASAAYLYDMHTAGYRYYGTGYGGQVEAKLVAETPPHIGQMHTISLTNAWLTGASRSVLLMGLEAAEQDTPYGGTLLVKPSYLFLLLVTGSGITIEGMVPDDPQLLGFHLFLQALELEPGGKHVAFTHGMELIYGY
ncbi:MAG: integrin alpha [Planctomycetota bacterium]